MNPAEADHREELLVGAMAEYDEALSAGTSTNIVDETVAEFDPQLAAEWAQAKECLELLDRVRRSGEPPYTRPEQFNGRSSVASAPRRLGRFLLERELGRGGLGIVYLSHDPQLGRKVALKVPRFEALLDDELRRRFLREAEAAARLNHPNLVALYEVGEDNSICYLASEYCPGPTLTQWLRLRNQPVPSVEAAKLVSVLADAMEHAHSRGVLHRDIKPSNVLLCETESNDTFEQQWSPKLTDFGMAKLLEQRCSDKTRTGAIIGTLAYMAPEQVEGRASELDTRTDVYALGAILYELLTGAPPFGGQSEVDVLRQLIVSEPVAPRRLRRDVPRDLEAITQKCLSRNPAARYATAGAMADDLQRFLEGRPTVARPLGVSARALKWTRRRPAIAALCLVSILAVALILGINARRIEDAGRALQETSQLRTLADEHRQRALDEEATTRRLLYASRMRKAQQAWREGNHPLVREMLQHYAEGKPEAGLRHFEWYHLNYLLNVPHRVFHGHTGRVYSVAYSPDGQFIVSGGADGTVRLWDVGTGETAAVLREHQGDVSSLVFAPDGDTFATSSGDKTVKVWSLSQRKPILTLPHPFPVDACMFLDGGKLLVSLSSETEGRRQSALWDMPSGTLRPAWPPPDEVFQAVIPGQSGRTAVTFVKNFATVWNRQDEAWITSRRIDVVNPRGGATLSPDEEYLLVPVWPRYLHIYRLRDGALTNVLKDHGGGVNCIAFSPRGDQIATSSDDTSVCVFEFPSGKLVHRFFGHEGGSVWHVAWSPSGNSLASVGNDGMIRVWDIERGSLQRHLRLPESRSRTSRGQWGYSVLQETGLWGFAFLQDGKRVNSVYHDGLSLVWNVASGQSSSPIYASRSLLPMSKNAIPFPEAAHVLLPQWDAHACSIPNRIGGTYSPSTAPTTNNCMRIVRDGSQMMEIRRGQLRVWDTESSNEIETRRISQFHAVEFVFDISSDGGRMCGADDGGHVYVCDVSHGTAVDLGSIDSPRAACFSPQGDRVLLLAGGKVREYDIGASKWTREFSQEDAMAIRYSADAQRIAISFENGGHTCIYDALTGEETFRLDVRASEILFASDGTSLVTDGAPDGGLYFWPGKKESLP